MKKLLMIVIVAAFSLSAYSQFTKATLQASGLTCAMCSKAVKVALEELPFIEKITVNIKSQEYNLTFREGADFEFDALKKAVEDAGFSVASLKVTGNFNSVKAEKDAHLSVGGKTLHFLNGNNQVINGERTIRIVDKGFVTGKEFKKYSTALKLECLQTGKAAACCTREGAEENSRIYHVTI